MAIGYRFRLYVDDEWVTATDDWAQVHEWAKRYNSKNVRIWDCLTRQWEDQLWANTIEYIK